VRVRALQEKLKVQVEVRALQEKLKVQVEVRALQEKQKVQEEVRALQEKQKVQVEVRALQEKQKVQEEVRALQEKQKVQVEVRALQEKQKVQVEVRALQENAAPETNVTLEDMDHFNDLLLKLQECHEREVGGWQLKLQEVSNKKGCDTKRMEELFSRNQQMKEQQRILMDNVKTLENRLRAGLCDRCTVTQEVAKKQQQEFEALHLQAAQHVTLMVAEINNLKKENKMLRDEARSLRLALDQSSRSSTSSAEKKAPDPPPAPHSLPTALMSRPLCRSSHQPAEGDATVKVEAPQRQDPDPRGETRHLIEWPRSLFDPYKPAANSASWKVPPQSVERRPHADDPAHSGSPPGKSRPPVSLSSLSPVPEAPSRHILHAPVPCRPLPLKSVPGPPPPWPPLGEPPDWATATASSQSKPRFPNLIPSNQHVNNHSALSRPAPGQVWHKTSAALQNPAKEAMVVFRLRGRSAQEGGAQRQEPPPQKEKPTQPPQSEEGGSHEGSECEGPLDLSDSGRTKPAARVSSPPGGAVQSVERPETSAELPSAPEASTTTTASTERREDGSETKDTPLIKAVKQKDEGKEAPGKKVPVLTISLRPVVLLESLNTAKQKRNPSSNRNSPEEAEGGSSSDEREEDSADSGCGDKRKREDSDSDELVQPERKVTITVRNEKSPT
ncbi:uncharacterized protein rbbp8l, partial [Eucyclogobius newberryi]|uniref:uncharacterized protein rbbp8l n=1 Tax=Eucyclogobius newberryi TaxID=166745 RepID=UPI003B5BE8FF